MATARANLFISVKDEASDKAREIFLNVVNASNKALTAQQALNKTNEQYVGWLRQQANAAASAATPNYTLAKGYTDMANSLEGNNQGLRLFGFNVVDVAAKLYLLQVGVRNVIQALQGVFELAEVGAQVRQQEIAFRSLVEGAGKDYIDYIELLREKSGGLITDFNLQQKASNAIIGTTGGVRDAMIEAVPSLLEFSRAFAALHPQVGSAEFVFNSLVTGIRRSSPRLIDNALIYLRLGEAVDAYARSVGKTSEELTDQERQLAIINATMEGGSIIVSQAGDMIDSLTDKYTIFRKELNETRDTAGAFLDTAIGPTIEMLNKMLGGVKEGRDAWEEFGEAISPIVKFFSWIILHTNPVIESIQAIHRAMVAAGIGGKEFSVNAEVLAQNLADLSAAAEEDAAQFEKWHDKVASAFNSLRRKQVDILIKSAEDQEKYGDRILEVQEKADRKRDDLFNDYARNSQRALRDHLDQMEDIEKRYNERRDDFLSRIEDVQQEKLTTGLGHAVEAAARRFAESRSMSEWDEVKAQLFAFDMPQSSRFDLMGQIIESQIDSLRDYQSVLQDLANDDTLTDEQRQAYAQQVEDINRQILGLDQELFDRRRDLDFARLDEKESLLREGMDRDEAMRREALDKEQADYDEHLTELSSKYNEALAELAESTNASVADLQNQIQEVIDGIDTALKEAVIDVGLGLAEAGSKVEETLLETKAAMHGVVFEPGGLVPDLQSVIDKISGAPDSLANAISQFNTSGNRIVVPVDFVQSDIPPFYGYRPVGFAPGRASGGPVMAGQTYTVGEAGPELFTPTQSGTITPSGEFGGVSIAINAGAFMGSRADATRLASELVPLIARGLSAYNINLFATGSRKTSSRS